MAPLHSGGPQSGKMLVRASPLRGLFQITVDLVKGQRWASRPLAHPTPEWLLQLVLPGLAFLLAASLACFCASLRFNLAVACAHTSLAPISRKSSCMASSNSNCLSLSIRASPDSIVSASVVCFGFSSHQPPFLVSSPLASNVLLKPAGLRWLPSLSVGHLWTSASGVVFLATSIPFGSVPLISLAWPLNFFGFASTISSPSWLRVRGYTEDVARCSYFNPNFRGFDPSRFECFDQANWTGLVVLFTWLGVGRNFLSYFNPLKKCGSGPNCLDYFNPVWVGFTSTCIGSPCLSSL